MRKLLLRGQQRLHWRTESEPRRRQITAGIAAIAEKVGMRAVIVVATSVPDIKQERARRLCLETLHPLLENLGVGTVVQEQRAPQQDRHDRQMVDALRAQRLLTRAVQVQFAKPNGEPLLWIPDAIAGAAGLARDGVGHHLKRLSLDVEHIDIPMR